MEDAMARAERAVAPGAWGELAGQPPMGEAEMAEVREEITREGDVEVMEMAPVDGGCFVRDTFGGEYIVRSGDWTVF